MRPLTLLPFLLLTTACTAPTLTSLQPKVNSQFMPEDGGVEIARTSLSGPSGALTTSGLTEDCAGPGLGVQVEGTTKSQAFLFDSNGNPCDAAKEIFNGRDDIHQRHTDATSIQVNFKDAFGSTSASTAGTELQPLNINSKITTSSTLPEDYATAPEGTLPNLNNVDFAAEKPSPGLAGTISKWDTERERNRMAAERQQVLTKSGQVLSGMRELDRLTSRDLIQAQHSKLLELMARLRDAERQIETEQQRHKQTLGAADKTRDVAEAKINTWQQREDQLNAEMSSLQARLGAFESLSQRLAQEKKNKEAAYTGRIQSLESQLKQAETEASAVRRELVLEAAQKIAEAERISFAARLAEQQAKKLEAERLKAEGNTLMARANELKSGNTIVVPRLANMFDPLRAEPAATKPVISMALEDVPITINVKDKPLNAIMADIFQNIRTVAGPWKIDWQLSGKAKYILEETWSLTAEVRFNDLMAHIQQKVATENNIILGFKRFDNSRLFVITDSE